MTDSPADRASIRDRLARPALALAAGTLVGLSMPPWGFWPLAIIGVILFEVALGANPSRRDRMLLGFLFGASWTYLGMFWMIQLTMPGYFIAGMVYGGYHLLAALIAPAGNWRVIGRPAAHTLAEALRFSFPFGGVPLASLGMSQVDGPFMGTARIGGVILITWIVMQLGFALAGPAPGVPGFARRFRPGASGAPHGAIAFLMIVLLVVVAAVAPRGATTGETLRVAAVQGGGKQGTSALDVPSIEVTNRHLDATRLIDPDLDLDLIIWPENTIDTPVFAGSTIHDAITVEAARLGTPIAVGITEDRNEGTRRINSQVIVTPDGEITARYDKVRRVPFGEYVPLRGLLEAVGAPLDQIGRDAVAGTGPAYIDLPDGTRLSVVISWEIFFAGRVREGVKEGAEAILNPTNGASYTGTIVQTQQVASSRLRAVETGRWVVQTAPTGFSAVIDSDGKVLQRTAVSEQKVLVDEIELRDGNTWYTNIGDGPIIFVLLLTLAASIWISSDRRDRAGAQPPASA